MARTSTVKFLDELVFKAKDYSGSGLYKRIRITGTTACTQGFPDVKTVLASGADADGIPNKLTTAATFADDLVGKQVYNVTDGTYATITAKDSATVLSLSADIMDSGETYKIYDTIPLVGDAAIIVPVTPVTIKTKITFGGGSELTFEAGTPIGLGKRVSSISDLDVDAIACSAYDGETLVFDVLVDYEEVVVSTDCVEELTLEYIDSKSGSSPEFTRSVKEKGVIRQRKQNLDPERTLSISQKYQSRTDGFMKLSGRDYILKVTRMDDNFLVATENDYYYQCYHNAPEPSGSSGAQDSTVSFDITYERRVNIGG